MLESLKRILDKLSTFDLASWLNSITISGYKVGLDTAQKDLKEEYPSEPDMEAIVRIGMRAHALSEKAIARAKGGMAHNADKLYQEMDAAMKAGMSEKEALHQIQGRLKGLFSDSYQEWELERLVRDQFLVATKEGRRAGWQNGGMKYRQWKIHLDNKTAADSKRMEGQITEIDKPYTDPLTGEKYMLPHIRPNDRCVFYGETKVYTSKGYKQIKDVQIGDLVLTHKGRFRKVYNTYNTPRKELLYKIFYSWDGGIPYTDFISVTGEHPFMTQRGWVRAKDLTTKDKLSILSTECKKCGKPIPIFRKFCSRVCISRNTAKKQWEDPEHRKNISAKTSVFWNKWNKENPERRKEIVKASHKVLAEKALKGEHPLQRPESIAKNWVFRPKEETLEIREKISKAISHDNLTNSKRISYLKSDKNLTGLWSKRGQNKSTDIEKRMEEELEKRDIVFTKQYNIKRFFVDFALEEHKIAIECDGWYWHQDKEKDYQRDLQIEAEGWTILHFTDNQIKKEIEKCVDEIQRVLKNHNGEYNFIPCNIKQIEITNPKGLRKTFNLDVEKDHSFTIKGIATHNCFETGLWELPEDIVERDGLVYAKNSESDFIKGGVGSGVKGHRTAKELNVHYKGGSKQQRDIIKKGIKQFEERFPKVMNEILNSQMLGVKSKKGEINVSFVGEHKEKKDFTMVVYYPNFYVNKNKTFGLEVIQHELVHTYQLTQTGYNEKIKFGKELYPKEPAYFINEYHAYAFDGLIYKLNKNQSKSKFNKDELWVAREHNINVNSFIKGGPGSGIRGHRTEKEPPKKLPKRFLLPADVEEILYKYEYMEKLTEYQLEKFRKQILGKVKEAKKKYTKIAGYFPGDTEFERLHRKLVVDLGKLENKLESAFTVGEKKIAIDAVFHLAHVHGRYAIFEGTGEDIKRALDYIRDQRIHKNIDDFDFLKGGEGSGIKGHVTYRGKKGYLKAIKEIELFEAQMKNEPYEYGRLIDKEGKILFSTEGRNPDSIYITDQQADILHSRKGFVFSHNHPASMSFSITDIYTSIKYNTKEVRAVSKRYLYVMKFKRYISLKDFESREKVYQEIYRKLFGQYNRKVLGGEITANEASIQMTHNVWENFVKMYPKDFEYTREPSKKGYGDVEKGGPGSGIKGHRTEKGKKYKNILSFEDKIRNEKKENGLLCDKDGNILLTAEGTEDTISFSPSDRELFFNKAAGGIFTHNHPLGNSFSRADIFSSMKAKLQEVRVVGKEYTHSIKFKKEVPANIRNEFPHRYDQVFAETYTVFMHKIFNGMSNRKAQQSCFHEMIQRISKEYSEYFTYKRTTSFSKGGIGSGIRGHTTAKKEKPKLYKVVEDFEEKYRNRISEIGLTTDKEGNVLLIKKGTKTRIKYTPEEWKILSSEKSYLFTHNHNNDATLSSADFDLMWRAGLKETRAVGPTNTFILKFKKKVPEEVFRKMLHTMTYKDEVFYHKYTSKVQKGEMKADIATIAYADEAMEAFVKEFPEYLSYEKITTIKKGGIGSGIKGHTTQKEKKVYKMIKNFENKIRGESIESCLVVDREGKVLVSKQGTESAIYLTENERYTCREKAKRGEIIFTHNHPSSSSFSLDDILTANNFHFSESRIASKEHDYVMKLSKPLDRDEVMTSYRAQNAYYYEIFNPLVVSEKLDRNKAWMTHTHLIWKHVAEEIDGLEYKRTR